MSYPMSAVMHNANLKEVVNDIIELANAQGGQAIMSSPALAIGSVSKAKVLNGAFTVVRDGVISTIAGGETAFTATTHDLLALTGAVYLIYLDSANAIKILKGTATTGGTGAVCPATPAGGLKIGEVKIVCANEAIFDATTTELDAQDLTVSYTNKTDVANTIANYTAKHWLHHQNLETLLTAIFAALRNSGDSILLSKPTLAIGTSDAKKIKHADLIVSVDGVITTVAGGEVALTATTHDLADGKGAVYNVYLDGSTVKILIGAKTDGGVGAVCPATPSGKLKLGELKVVTAGAGFTANTTALSAATVTDTYADVTDVNGSFNMSSYYSQNYEYSKEFKALLDDLEVVVDKMINNRVMSNPTWVIGTSSKKKIKNSAFNVMRDGVMSTIGSTETAFTATTDDIADGKEAVYNVYLSDANAITILKGTEAAVGSAVCPATPTGGLKVGEIKISADGAIFNASTDDLDASHLTVTYINKVDTLDLIV
jgi:hypothetical protein